MIEISVGTGECRLIFDQGTITAAVRSDLSDEYVEAGMIAYRVVRLAPGDNDYNAALMVIEEYGGKVVRYNP